MIIETKYNLGATVYTIDYIDKAHVPSKPMTVGGVYVAVTEHRNDQYYMFEQTGIGVGIQIDAKRVFGTLYDAQTEADRLNKGA